MAAVVPVLAPGGALDVPADPQVIGWWSAGPRPGSAAGTVVLAGHVDTAEHMGWERSPRWPAPSPVPALRW